MDLIGIAAEVIAAVLGWLGVRLFRRRRVLPLPPRGEGRLPLPSQGRGLGG
ncbi:MAG: hypothetical protein V3T90_03050 [Anaerolineae bacterium]